MNALVRVVLMVAFILRTLSLPAHDYLPREYIDVNYQIESPEEMQSDMFQLYPELEQAFRAKPLEPYEKNHLQQEADKDYILSESPKTDISGANEDNFYDIPLGIPDEERNVPGEPLTPEDFENALKLELLVPPQEEGSVDPLEVAGLFQGDIAGVNISDLVLERNAIRDLGLRWSRGIVPYVISASFSVYERSVIAAAFLDYHQHSCIKFVPRTTQQDYVYLLKGAGCSSAVGRQGGSQQVSLGPGCVYKGIIVHELMHAVGFWHEQSRGDRDHFVTVLWDNIQRGMEFNFYKFSARVMQDLDTAYDTSSVMHYGMYSFSKDRRSPTIIPKRENTVLLGQRRGFSQTDIVKVNRLYECRSGVAPTSPTVPVGAKPVVCSDNHRYCRHWYNTGECKTNPTWMVINCARSCTQCAVRCEDHNQHCERWATIGECAKNPDYMNIYCARACGACSDGGSTSCEDRSQHCKYWAKSGQCQENPSYMLQHCRRACRMC